MALKEEKQEEIHVLMVTAPSQGHINPMLRLGKRLLDKGVHVSLATTLFGGHRMLKASIITSISGPNVISGIPILFFSDGVSLDYDRSGNLDYFMETLAKTGPFNLSKLIKDYYHDAEKEAIESMAQLCPIRPVGPLVPPSLLDQNDVLDGGISMWKADETSLEWLNNQEPSSVIYVAFGSSSLLYLPAKLMEAIATALKNSNRPFLWVVKQSEFPRADGAGQLPLGFEEETKHQGLIVPWSPQTKVLAHPSIACFITHCGWNSMSETLAAGVPVIALPQWTDQPTNAKLFVDVFKVGLRLNPSPDGGIVKEELEKCIREVLSGPKSEEFKKNVVRLKQAARAAVASGGSSDRNIQLFVDEISGNLPR
ncbi:UDP-glucuronosyl/UDP-glucosyltransferase [Corchorus capsularis]|uniref:UDP-glucuronosyl/UDP-glucosyltransferase n=1 Tax=Corchorus capsularis TaxID=210143 RepID=A0A1R3HUE2_COCAP|nr:UDP-glucuronosyl/UDP-glucosyltransferase [Corchorus capsularis]